MSTISLATLDPRDIDNLETYAHSVPEDVRDVLLSIARCARAGGEIALIDGSEALTFTPSQVAARLGVSRTHLYKLLDRGEIPSHRVGRDRRILLEDLAHYEEKRQSVRRELAERFASQDATRRGAIDELDELI